jgi:mannose-6-phosphate isomerase-like protein (cupin superfamily)
MSVVKSKKHAKSAWLSKSQKDIKPWGSEVRWAALPSIQGKILYIDEGCRTSYKFHKSKNEVLLLLKGRAMVTFGSEYSLADPIGHPIKTVEMVEGDCLNVQSCCPYRVHALENCQFIEIGDANRDDLTRIEDDYGRAKKEE